MVPLLVPGEELGNRGTKPDADTTRKGYTIEEEMSQLLTIRQLERRAREREGYPVEGGRIVVPADGAKEKGGNNCDRGRWAVKWRRNNKER